ncbi:MAG: acyloxyacyl hydrolase [Bacteroidales bacterium]
MAKKFYFIILIIFINSSAHSAEKNDIRVGLGVSMFSSGAGKEVNQYGIYGVKSLHRIGFIAPYFNLMLKINGSAGNVRVEKKNALFFSVGPSIELSMYEYFLNVGINPILISKYDFYNIHLGGPLQFVVYAEIDFPIISNFSIGFRTQHISNADIYPENHGFNTYMLLLNCSI